MGISYFPGASLLIAEFEHILQIFQEKMEVTSTLREIVKEKQASHDDKMHEGHILSQFVKDMKTEKFAQEDVVVKILFSTLFATTETNSSIISLALKLLSENPSAIEQLQVSLCL